MDAKMFCFQCQEAAKGTGCTIKGVCGKDDETAKIGRASCRERVSSPV